MAERIGEIIHNEISVYTDADMIEFARRYKELGARRGRHSPMGVVKEDRVRESLREMLSEHLNVVLQNEMEGDTEVRIRVFRDKIQISGIGNRPSVPQPTPRNERSVSRQYSHY